uniref:GRAM domain-containing protein n=1 Tax=Xiphophorus maculatus TaxID=8083 RepID=A0A3B5QJ63_XIPMA
NKRIIIKRSSFTYNIIRPLYVIHFQNNTTQLLRETAQSKSFVVFLFFFNKPMCRSFLYLHPNLAIIVMHLMHKIKHVSISLFQLDSFRTVLIVSIATIRSKTLPQKSSELTDEVIDDIMYITIDQRSSKDLMCCAPTLSPNSFQRPEENMKISDRFRAFLDNFHFHRGANEESEEGLNPIKMTQNMRRFEKDMRPVEHFFRNLSALSSWRSVHMTACFFFIYMCTVWHGWTFSFVVLFMVLQLSFNYLISKGWRIEWSIIPDMGEPVEHLQENLNMVQMFHWVAKTAQKTQKLFGNMADMLEKINNLCMWARPELTVRLYVGLWLGFIFSCMLPFQLLGFVIGVSVGIKIFIINLIFERFPKLRQQFDVPYNFWADLPTDLQLRDPRNTLLSRWKAKVKARWSTARRSISNALLGARRRRLFPPRSRFIGTFHVPPKLSPNLRPWGSATFSIQRAIWDRLPIKRKHLEEHNILFLHVTKRILHFVDAQFQTKHPLSIWVFVFKK